jgi:hypothetical protein
MTSGFARQEGKMTTNLNSPNIDKARRGFGAMVWTLNPLRAASPAAAPPTALVEIQDGWMARPMIKPSARQQVAIDAHRRDWP